MFNLIYLKHRVYWILSWTFFWIGDKVFQIGDRLSYYFTEDYIPWYGIYNFCMEYSVKFQDKQIFDGPWNNRSK